MKWSENINMQKNDFQDKFYVGCNYWASHAGTNMWREWDETIVRKDLSDLYEYGVRVIRVFPLWSDFQPVKMLYGELGKPCEIRMGETALGNDEFGKAGVSARCG